MVHSSSKEFKDIEALFSKTLKGTIVKIERVQNKQLWDTYQLYVFVRHILELATLVANWELVWICR